MSAIKSAQASKALIASAARPYVMVQACKDVDEFAKSLDAANFLDLLAPYGYVGNVTVRDSQTMANVVEHFEIAFRGPLAAASAPQVTSDLLEQDTQLALTDPPKDDPLAGPGGSPIYSQYLDTVVSGSTEMVPYETLNHPVSGILAVSSRTQDPIEAFTRLYQDSFHVGSGSGHINSDFLRYFVYVHDMDSSAAKAHQVFDELKQQFGSNCAIISLGTSQPDVNAENIRTLVRDMVTHSIIPYMERCVSVWNEQIASSRQGFAGKLFSVSKRYLATPSKLTKNVLHTVALASGKTVIPVEPRHQDAGTLRNNFNIDAGVYYYTTPEAQLRKLADFAFILRDYKFAYSTYDMLRKDYHNDKAWAYLAAAQEMAAVSYLLSCDSLSQKTYLSVIEPLLDSTVYTYISRCHLPIPALRCLLTVSELLCAVPGDRTISGYAVGLLLKARKEQLAGPLGSILLIERISNCYACHDERLAAAAEPSHRARKAALYMLLAARDWSRQVPGGTAKGTPAGTAAERCLARANALGYQDLPWTQEPSSLVAELAAKIN